MTERLSPLDELPRMGLLPRDAGMLVISCLAYSLYSLAFCHSVHALFFALKDIPHRVLLVCVAIILLTLTTSQLFLFLSILWLQLFSSRDSIAPTVVQPWVFVANICLADAIFIFRLYHIWGRNWKVTLFPIFFTLVSPIGLIVMTLLPYTQDIPDVSTIGIPLATPTATFVANLYITSMITYKVWRNNRSMRLWKMSPRNSVMSTILESAGIYTGWALFVCLGTFFAFFFGGVLLDAGPSLSSAIGISYSLMIILVAQGRSRDIRYTSLAVSHIDEATII